MSNLRTQELTNKKDRVVAFSSSLGWIAIRSCNTLLSRLTFGHDSLNVAVESLEDDDPNVCRPNTFERRLIKRIQAFTDGQSDDLLDVDLDLSHLSAFGQNVVTQCRQIPYGSVLSYGELALKANSPNAARAVGRVMRKNRYPLIVPCHRVVAAGSLGGFSAPDGLDMKRRLLEMEGSLQTLFAHN